MRSVHVVIKTFLSKYQTPKSAQQNKQMMSPTSNLWSNTSGYESVVNLNKLNWKSL